ncbi:GNAT family N-acetyltransferase [Paenibacillus sp. DYY-L-2]|uniref:GNAT family N-acetyltransferase n=1 Tax=Paenibacillus sp. DYY-L-2 TaxID=3447013 RepID=UPI003F507C3D
MDIRIKPLRKEDFNSARKFAIEGMHLTWYTSNKVELYLYSIYFWYLEISRATIALGAYRNNKLAGVLLADMNKEPKVFQSIWYRAFVKLGDFLINIGYKDASSVYHKANNELLKQYLKNHEPDGELNFFAVDPALNGQGIGTMLLKELENQEKGKQIYLYTDTGSTYQFYAHRGFEEIEKKEISLTINKEEVPLTCFLFGKKL